jgi:hypothetical protein
MRPLSTFMILLGLAGVGCRFIDAGAGTTATDQAATRAAGKPAARTIPLEILFVRCDAHDPAVRDELWSFADEQFLATAVRGRLAANGLRVGIVGDHLPAHLAGRFTGAGDDLAGSGTLATDAALARRQLWILPGRRSEIVTASGIRELVLLERSGDEVHGATYRDASTTLVIEARPAADGRVRITAVPEIRHGPHEKSWVGEDGMFRLETGQRRQRLEQLQFTATLPRDGMLIVGSAGADSASLGDCLLRDHDRGDGTSIRLLAIRPLADTVDPLFASAEPGAEASLAEPPLTVR